MNKENIKNQSKVFFNNIKKSFNGAAHTYDDNALLQHEAGSRLADRLQLFTIKPELILDLGMATGKTTKLVADKYPNSKVIGLDFAENMLEIAKATNLKDIKNVECLLSDINTLPFDDNSVDLIFSNFTLQWCENITKMFKECHRVLKNEGLFIFSIPGPDTLAELRYVFDQVDSNFDHVNNFIDMHDLGDILVQTKFAHPVMDSEHFTLTYSSVINILKDLKAVGANTVLSENIKNNLMSKSKLAQLEKQYKSHFILEDGKLPLTYEVSYGHAFKTDKPVKVKHPELSEVMVPIEKIIKK